MCCITVTQGMKIDGLMDTRVFHGFMHDLGIHSTHHRRFVRGAGQSAGL
jgi:hypothetical protein